MREIDKKAYEVLKEASLNYEKELIRKVQKTRDKEAFYKLVKLYDGRVFSLAYRFLGNKEDAVELAQDVFLRIYRKINQYRFEALFVFWLQRITVNMCFNKIRTYKKDLLKRAADFDYRVETADNSHERGDPLFIMEEEEKKVFMRECLGKLPPVYRMVVLLKDIEGFSYEEIAKLTKSSMGTVKSRLSRGREELKSIFCRLKKEVKEYGM